MTDKKLELNTNNQPVVTTKLRSKRFQEMKESFLNLWREFRKVKFGLVGLGLLFVFLLVIIFEPLIVTFPEVNTRWRDITYWEENPTSAAPAWTNWFSKEKSARQAILPVTEESTRDQGGMQVIDKVFTYNYNYDVPPMELMYRTTFRGNVTFTIDLVRPDGEQIRLVRRNIRANENREIRMSLGKEGINAVYDFGLKHDPANVTGVTRQTVRPARIIFGQAEAGMLREAKPLKGDYQIKVSAVLVGPGAVEDSAVVVSGRVFGILGTDTAKRDIWSGVIAGTKWALLIGLLVAFVAVFVGVLYGVTAAYFGGWVDMVMMRVQEIFASIPFLPILIVISAIFKPSVWTLLTMMCIFYWVGPVRTVRSIGLQIKQETYIEAAHALDASNSRIIFRHMVPQLIPYAFANMALMVPSAIVAEATISLLGLGDPTIVTWGQILHAAQSGGAMLQGLWWWVVPPGFFIALMGMTFAFIGFAMDTILNPKLRTR